MLVKKNVNRMYDRYNVCWLALLLLFILQKDVDVKTFIIQL